MTTHYHLLLQTPTANLSAGMHKLNGVYAQAFNRRHALPGHVFEGRYRGLLVEREAHLLELARYIVLNPVRAGVSGAPGSWPWSNYRATAGLAPVPEFLTVDWTLAQCGANARHAQASYRRFVRDGHVQGPGPQTCPPEPAPTRVGPLGGGTLRVAGVPHGG